MTEKDGFNNDFTTELIINYLLIILFLFTKLNLMIYPLQFFISNSLPFRIIVCGKAKMHIFVILEETSTRSNVRMNLHLKISRPWYEVIEASPGPTPRWHRVDNYNKRRTGRWFVTGFFIWPINRDRGSKYSLFASEQSFSVISWNLWETTKKSESTEFPIFYLMTSHLACLVAARFLSYLDPNINLPHLHPLPDGWHVKSRFICTRKKSIPLFSQSQITLLRWEMNIWSSWMIRYPFYSQVTYGLPCVVLVRIRIKQGIQVQSTTWIKRYQWPRNYLHTCISSELCRYRVVNSNPRVEIRLWGKTHFVISYANGVAMRQRIWKQSLI